MNTASTSYAERYMAATQNPLSESYRFDWLPIKPEKRIGDSEQIGLLVRQAIKGMPFPVDPVGECYFYTQCISMDLCMKGIPHSVTIGDVEVNGKPLYGTTAASLADDLSAGYDQTAPANAHAWITLPDGEVVDAVILHSIARREKRKPLKLIQSIYLSHGKHSQRINHIPVTVGVDYIEKVVAAQNPVSAHMIGMWLQGLAEVNQP